MLHDNKMSGKTSNKKTFSYVKEKHLCKNSHFEVHKLSENWDKWPSQVKGDLFNSIVLRHIENKKQIYVDIIPVNEKNLSFSPQVDKLNWFLSLKAAVEMFTITKNKGSLILISEETLIYNIFLFERKKHTWKFSLNSFCRP